MLGERRSNSLFAPAAPAEPERKPEQAEVHDISFEERTGRSLFAEAATAPRASELFFAPQEKGVTFAEALSQVQSYLSETYATLITEDNSDAKDQMKRRMARYLQENRIAVDGMTASELVDALYTEMAEYGFLTKYIFADGIEEIDINSWRDIEIQYSDGHTAKLEEHFDSPEHAANVIRRMLQNSGKVLDNASPIITSRLAKNIRISVIKTPVLDEDAGVAASIRMLVLALAVRILPVFVAKQQLDTYAVELVREAEISGRVGTETNRRAAALTDSTGLDPNIRWSKTGRIQLNEEVTVTLTLDMDIGLFGGFSSFPITLRSEATGKSEVYWK